MSIKKIIISTLIILSIFWAYIFLHKYFFPKTVEGHDFAAESMLFLDDNDIEYVKKKIESTEKEVGRFKTEIYERIDQSEKSQNIQFIFTASLSIITFIISVIFQYRENKNANTYKIMQELPQAIEEMNIIVTVLLKNNRYNNIIDTIGSKIFTEFSRSEIETMIKKDYKGKENIFKQIEKIINAPNMQCKYDKYLEENYINKKCEENFPLKFPKFIDVTLDKMSFLCENIINTKSKYIYKQYNTTLLSLIHKLSIIIVKDNKDVSNQKYISIIKLYKKWQKNYQA